MPPQAVPSELAAAYLQAAVMLGVAILCGAFYQRYRKPYLRWWAVAWCLYVLRIGAISRFLLTGDRAWLYWHQVITGWTALALLWAAVVFSRQLHWRRWFILLVLFPPVWSYIAIYRLQQFLLAAGPAVLFLSMATLWTGWVFVTHWRRTGSRGALWLAATFLLWGLHHLDYPLLRARGAWNPWGYYLDILFVLAIGGGIFLLVLEDVHRGLAALATLSGDLQSAGRGGDHLRALLARPLELPGVRGSAMYQVDDGGQGRFVRGLGACQAWTGQHPEGAAAGVIAEAVRTGRPAMSSDWTEPLAHGGATYAYAAVLPVFQSEGVRGALIIVGDARDPFTALDEDFLRALGQQVGAALENADLSRRLQARANELERLSARMVQQHEEERRRLSLELHDETAQVFSAVKLQLGVLREAAAPELGPRFDHVIMLIDQGIRSLRNLTNDLRPSLLDDLGLLPALRTLVADFSHRTGLEVGFDAPATVPAPGKEGELALFRAVQEGLSNVARHAGARSVSVSLKVHGGALDLRIADDGRGLPSGGSLEGFERDGHMGLAGMRERITALGGTVAVEGHPGSGVRLLIHLPLLRGTLSS